MFTHVSEVDCPSCSETHNLAIPGMISHARHYVFDCPTTDEEMRLVTEGITAKTMLPSIQDDFIEVREVNSF